MFLEKELSKTVFVRQNLNELTKNSNTEFNFPFLIESLKQEEKWINGDLNMMILLKSPKKKVVLTILHAGTEIDSQQLNDSITIKVLEGRLNLHIRERSVSLIKGEQLTLNEKLNYSYNSVEETAYLLTIT